MTPADYQRRRSELMAKMAPDSVAIIAAGPEQIRYRDVHHAYRPDSDLRYLTGFLEPEAVAVLIPGRAEGEFVLFCRDRNPERELWDGRRAGPAGASQDYAADQAWAFSELDQQMTTLLSGRSKIYLSLARRGGFQRRVMGWIDTLKQQTRRGVDTPQAVLDLDNLLHEMRLIKQSEEIAAMQKAADVSAAAHCRAMQACEPGMHEYAVAAELHYEFERHGMTEAYGSIVGGGANACILHYIENQDELKAGDLLLIDAGAEHEGYCADITRTFPVNGRFSEPQKALYNIVLKAQLAAIAAVKPGNDWNAPHEAAVRQITAGLLELGLLSGQLDLLIEEEAYKTFYMHSTGHWLGMDVHDVGQYKVGGHWRALESGMVLTVEPGIYIPAETDAVPEQYWDIGIRIEDDVLVTEDGHEVLTHAVPKKIADIEALMAPTLSPE